MACNWCATLGHKIECWCASCHGDVMAAQPNPLQAILLHHMYLCPTCGNKRCPKSTQHDLACTRSNEPGQPGSRY